MTPAASSRLLPALALWLVVALVIGGSLAWIASDLGPSLATVGVRTVYACAGACLVCFALAALSAAVLAGSIGSYEGVGAQVRDLGFFWNLTLLAYLAMLAAYYAHRTGYLV